MRPTGRDPSARGVESDQARTGKVVMPEANARSSSGPLWIGALVGVLAGFVTGPLLLLVTVPVAIAIGYSVKSRRDAALDRAAQQRRIDELFERVALLEYSMRRGPSAPSAAAVEWPREVVAPPPVPPSAAPLEVPTLPSRESPTQVAAAAAAPVLPAPAEPGLVYRGVQA